MCLLSALEEDIFVLKNKEKKDCKENVAQNNDDNSDLTPIVLSFVCRSNEWILTSTCTYHMCPKVMILL